MLERDYCDQFSRLLDALDETVTAPPCESDGVSHQAGNYSFAGDMRRNQRLRIATGGVAWIELGLPCLERPSGPLSIFTRDFSPRACGLYSPLEIFPGEILRVLLPTFWMTVRVLRCCRENHCCYGAGAELIRRFAPSDEAFQHLQS